MPSVPHRRRFILIDPCLDRLGAHPFHYAVEVLGAAEEAGWLCTLATHRNLRIPAALPPEWRVHPTFEHTGYSKYTALGGLDRLDARGRRRLWLAAPWEGRHARRRRAQRIGSFARDVRSAIEGLRTGDVVFVATASELDAAGLARAIADSRPPAGVNWHLQFHGPLYRGNAPDFPRQERRLDPVRRLLQEAIAAASPHTLHFHVTTEELAAQYDRLGAGEFSVLPYPAQQGLVRGGEAPREDASAAGRLRVAVLGDARPEKNSHHLATIVDSAAQDALLADRVRFAVQSNLGFAAHSRARTHMAVREAIRALAMRSDDLAELLEGPFDAGAYGRQLAAADIMLLAYDPDRYRARCSGILLETLAAGVVPIVTGGGWMARQLADPLRQHAQVVLARSRILTDERVESARPIRRQPLTLPVEPPAGTTALVVDLSWRAQGRSCLHEPPARVALDGIPTRPPTVAGADPLGHPTSVVFPVPPQQPAPVHEMRVTIAPAYGADDVDLASIRIRCAACAGRVPAGAVGVVIEGPQGVPDALREVVQHADYYRQGAIAHAQNVRAASNAAQVVRQLLG